MHRTADIGNQLIPSFVTHAHLGQPFILSTAPINAGSGLSSLKPQATYNGGYADAKTVRLRLANGGAGQAGLIGAFADAFIQWRVTQFKEDPFLVRTLL